MPLGRLQNFLSSPVPLRRLENASGLLLFIFRYFLLFLIVFGCFVIVWVVFGCGRVWERLGRRWALPALLYAVSRDFLYFSASLRRQRAERRERSERCEAPGLLLCCSRCF